MNRNEAYSLGYRHGSDSAQPDTRPLGMVHCESREAYFEGYVRGSQDRDERLARGEGHVPRPGWMTDAQFEAIGKLYRRSPDGTKDRHEFFARVKQHGGGRDKYAGLHWCGMFIGIETDGYAHS